MLLRPWKSPIPRGVGLKNGTVAWDEWRLKTGHPFFSVNHHFPLFFCDNRMKQIKYSNKSCNVQWDLPVKSPLAIDSIDVKQRKKPPSWWSRLAPSCFRLPGASFPVRSSFWGDSYFMLSLTSCVARHFTFSWAHLVHSTLLHSSDLLSTLHASTLLSSTLCSAVLHASSLDDKKRVVWFYSTSSLFYCMSFLSLLSWHYPALEATKRVKWDRVRWGRPTAFSSFGTAGTFKDLQIQRIACQLLSLICFYCIEGGHGCDKLLYAPTSTSWCPVVT